jgi:hypothetical protein
MRALESSGYEEMADPPGLRLTLYPFQRQSLQWMVDRETQPGGLNALFWREHPSEGRDRSFFYNAMAGELRSEPLPIVVRARALEAATARCSSSGCRPCC